ncbi:MAG: hypothetical protein FJ130_00695 [Deltaproteobacteria bacterium]|nr:hypothetical protein [Deltaproteobacteria bacterium]
MEDQTFHFQLNQRPPFFKNLAYGFQWAMIAIPNVAVFSALCGTALGLDPSAQISFSQRLLIVTGLMTLFQSLKGHQYPILEGPSSALLLSFIVLAPEGFPAIGGGMIFGGFFLMLVCKLKLFKKLSSFFTPNVVGVILVLVVLSLLPFLYPLLIGMDKTHPNGELGIAGSSLLIILFVSLFSYWLRGFFQTTSMLAGILLGLILFLIKGEISLTVIKESSWFALPSPIWGGRPTFSVAPIIAMVFTYMAVMINTVGSIQGISEIVGKEGLEDRIHRGIGMNGAGGLVAAFLGVVGLVSFSISPGVVLVTRVASRYSLTMSGVIMIVCAFIPKLWALLTVIPPSVVASTLFVVFASQLIAGISAIMSGKGRMDRRDYFTVGLPLLMGATVSIIAKPFFHFFPSAIASLVSNGLVVGIFFALFCEHVFFKPRA